MNRLIQTIVDMVCIAKNDFSIDYLLSHIKSVIISLTAIISVLLDFIYMIRDITILYHQH